MMTKDPALPEFNPKSVRPVGRWLFFAVILALGALEGYLCYRYLPLEDPAHHIIVISAIGFGLVGLASFVYASFWLRALRKASQEHTKKALEEFVDRTSRERFYHGIRPDDVAVGDPFLCRLPTGYMTGFSVTALLPDGPVTQEFILKIEDDGTLSAEPLRTT